MKILIVEDDRLLRELLATTLGKNHYICDLVDDGQSGFDLAINVDYDLILLDVNIPKLDGITLCRQLRGHGYNKPILLLTPNDSDEMAIAGFDAGADDYIIKPCTPDVILAKMRTLLRRSGAFVARPMEDSSHLLTWGELKLDLNSGRVTFAGQVIALTTTEYNLLELLLRNPERIFSRSVILDRLWGFDDAPTDRAINTYIKDLRKKLKAGGLTQEIIETVYGMGYRLKPHPEKQPQVSKRDSTMNRLKRFQGIFENRISVLEQAKIHLMAGKLEPALQEAAQQEAHKLAGSLASFGYPNGSKLARSIEHLLIKSDLSLSRDCILFSELVSALGKEILKEPDASLIIAEASFPKSFQVLIIDDDITLTGMLKAEASMRGFQLQIALNPITARSYLASTIPDVVLLDLSFPGTEEDGLSLLREIKAQHPDLPIIVFTGRGSLSDRLMVSRLGVQQFLQKPATIEQIFGAFARVLAKSPISEAKILIIDDDPSILEFLTALLTPWGLEVTTLRESQEFWEVLTTSRPDLILVDLEIPEVNGLELCQIVRQDAEWGDLPILVITSHTDSKSLQEAFAVGADDFITKPVLGPELVTRILCRIERKGFLKKLGNTNSNKGKNI